MICTTLRTTPDNTRQFQPTRRPVLWVASALLLAAAAALPARAADEPTVVRVWGADWRLGGLSPGDVKLGNDRGEMLGSSGALNVTAAVDKGSLSGNMNLTFDPSQGTIRSGTSVSATLKGDGPPEDYGWGDFNYSSTNAVAFQDQLTVAAGGFGFMTIMVRTSGSVGHSALIVDSPYAFSDISLYSGIDIHATIGGGEQARFRENIQSNLLGIFDGKFSVNESRSVNNFMEVIVPWESGLPVDFSFGYQEFHIFKVRGVDAERVELTGNNSFGHTLQLFANVFDGQGNLLEGVQVGSSQGIFYDNLTPVPEPGSWLLFSAGLLGLGAMSRRRALQRTAEVQRSPTKASEI